MVGTAGGVLSQSGVADFVTNAESPALLREATRIYLTPPVPANVVFAANVADETTPSTQLVPFSDTPTT